MLAGRGLVTSCPKCKGPVIQDTEGRDVCLGCKKIVGEGSSTRTPSPRTSSSGKFSGVNKARARQRPGKMNPTERARAEVLEQLRQAGEIQGWLAQAVTLQLGERCTYRPDFLVLELDGGVTLEEVKGSHGWRLDPKGRIKFKWAAEAFPFFTFRGVIQKDGGGWESEEHTPLATWPSTQIKGDIPPLQGL